MGDWSALTSFEEVRRRAGGRNRYNSLRRLRASFRRTSVVKLLEPHSTAARGAQARMARALGVSESTISRDLKFLLYSGGSCPTCGSFCQPPIAWKPIRTGRRAAD